MSDLSLPEQQAFQLPRDAYDLRCTNCELTETKESHMPMLAFTYEIAYPIEKVLPGQQQLAQIAGKEVRDWIVLYGKAIAELEATPTRTAEQEKQLIKFRNLQTNPSFGSLRKLGAIHASMQLPMSIDEEMLDTSIYIGKTVAALLYSERADDKGSDGQPIVGLDGKPLQRFNVRLSSYLGAARHPEAHLPY